MYNFYKHLWEKEARQNDQLLFITLNQFQTIQRLEKEKKEVIQLAREAVEFAKELNERLKESERERLIYKKFFIETETAKLF